jgi:hypothetical protein
MKSVKSYNDMHVKKNKDYIISKQLIIRGNVPMDQRVYIYGKNMNKSLIH